jgi:phage gp37-like protein
MGHTPLTCIIDQRYITDIVSSHSGRWDDQIFSQIKCKLGNIQVRWNGNDTHIPDKAIHYM